MQHILLPLAAATAEAHGDGKIDALLARFGIEWPFLISQVISFSIVAFLLYRFAFKPVLETIEERQRRIAEGLKHAEEMKAKLAEAEARYAETLKKASVEAQKIIDEARASAKELVERETRAASEKTQEMIARAEEAIELERRKMIAEVRDEVSRLVVLTVSRVLKRELGSEERKRYSEAAARELSEV
ncbi:MAG: ATP synthase F0 subunit B [Verrucomicrobia bacterium]|nr:MAG: ATP synthase F0 subunit B [Verrucomicrobiota bacterium]